MNNTSLNPLKNLILEINKKYLYLPIINDEVTEIFIDNPNMYTKLLTIVENVGKDFEFNTLECLTTKKNTFVIYSIYS